MASALRIAALALVLALLVPGAAAADGPAGRTLLGGEWLYRADPADEGVQRGLHHEPGTNGWSPVGVPNAFNAGDESIASQVGSVGWYRKDFTLPSADPALEWAVRFESVNYRARIWLNGEPVGARGRLAVRGSAGASRGGGAGTRGGDEWCQRG